MYGTCDECIKERDCTKFIGKVWGFCYECVPNGKGDADVSERDGTDESRT